MPTTGVITAIDAHWLALDGGKAPQIKALEEDITGWMLARIITKKAKKNSLLLPFLRWNRSREFSTGRETSERLSSGTTYEILVVAHDLSYVRAPVIQGILGGQDRDVLRGDPQVLAIGIQHGR